MIFPVHFNVQIYEKWSKDCGAIEFKNQWFYSEPLFTRKKCNLGDPEQSRHEVTRVPTKCCTL